ncbi:MAG TPA: outer membrane protein assembly factor BamD [Candidatus Udaeobacter sp.]|nr:outer membrane protein assembly factor BamD [Candidatus Udaeobacter sp.]
MKTAITCVGVIIATCCCHATGGDSYEHPVKLSDTLDILPGKSLGEIFFETSTIQPPANSWDSAKLRELADRIGKEPLPKLLKTADDLIAQARASYKPGSDSCNLAHDVRDAVAVSAENPGAAREYILARLDAQLPPDEIDRRAESATGAIKANWLYWAGARRFAGGDREDCQAWFDRVVEEFPNSPRAEMAMFMSARCAFSATRRLMDRSEDDETLIKARKTAIAKFETLRKKDPRGRFDADALGWLGAIAFDSNDYLKALEYYIAQAETPGHPEALMSAIFNAEKALGHLAPKPGGDAAFALIARHPRIAMAFTYLVLASPEADNYNGEWDNPADVRKWRRTILPRIATAVAKQKDNYKSDDWKPRYLAMLVHAASASGNQTQALQLSQVSPEQLKQSDDLLFARAVALQRANKTPEATDELNNFLQIFPKSPMTPGVKIRLALALADNHQAGNAIATLRDLIATGSPKEEQSTSDEEENADQDHSKADQEATSDNEDPASADEATDDDSGSADEAESVNEDKSPAGENSIGGDNNSASENAATGFGPTGQYPLVSRFYMSDSNGYPAGELQWNAVDSAVYGNISGADEEQIYQFIDTLLNFAPLPELLATPDHEHLSKTAKRRVRAILAERYLAAENFAEAKKYITDPHQLGLVNRLEQLTNDKNGTAQQQAERMLKIGDTWAEARGLLLRAPLDTELHEGEPVSGLLRRDNGRALRMANVENELDERDELHHASRWWLRAARTVPGTPVSAKARLKALEALPQIARDSLYAEQRAREIKLEAVSREIYDRLRAESPNSPEAQRFAAYWSLPTEAQQSQEGEPSHVTIDGVSTTGSTASVSCDDDALPLGYPISVKHAFDALTRKPGTGNSGEEQERYRVAGDLDSSVKALRGSFDPKTVGELARLARGNISTSDDVTLANCLDDLTQFVSEPNVSDEARTTYVNVRLDLLHRTLWPDSPVDPGIWVQDSDEGVEAEIDVAQKNPALQNFHDYLDFCRIGLAAGKRIEVKTNIPGGKEPDGATYHSRDFAKLEKMTRDFLAKYPQSKKREAAMFVLARAIYSLSAPYILCMTAPAAAMDPHGLTATVQKSYQVEPFDPKRVMQALDDYDRHFPNGRYAADVRDMRAATFWRMGEWDKALDLTLAQIAGNVSGDLLGVAETRLANIFAELANFERRPQVLEIIRTRPNSLPYLAAYVGAATNDRDHPLRYLQRYLSDQLHFKIPAPPTGDVASN